MDNGEYTGRMPIRKDIKTIPSDEPAQLKLGFRAGISPIMMSACNAGANWSCSICKEHGQGYPSYRMANVMGDLHLLNHKGMI